MQNSQTTINEALMSDGVIPTNKPKQRIFLKSTGQEVFDLPYTGQDVRPWPQGYRQVLRRFLSHEGKKSGLTGETMIVKECNLEFK